MRHFPYRFISTIIILIFCVRFEADAKSYTVFAKGHSDYAIVVDKDASESELFAAKELQNYIVEIGGVTIPIVGCGEWKKGKRIIVGYNKDSKILLRRLKQPSPSDASILYKNKRGDIVLVGGKERGTMYAVFSFLENELGCRWYSQDCIVIPKRDSFFFSKLKREDKPAFPRRSIIYSEISDPVFRAHCRLNERLVTRPTTPVKQIGGYYSFLSPHTMAFILPVEKYYSEHPEYYALVKGKRVQEQTQPCFSNPDVLRICVREVRTIIKEHPEFDIVEISALDNENRCECDECKKFTESLGNYTDLVLYFVNQVADSVQLEFPEKRIEFLAYGNTQIPPLMIKPHDNVVVRLCDPYICHLHGFASCDDEKSKQFRDDLVKWRSLTDNLCCWEYATDFSWRNIPFPNFYALQDNLKQFAKIGLLSAFVQGNNYSYNGEFQALRIYVLSKLLWNPNCNLDEIIDDFIFGYYGTSASYIRQYFDLIHYKIQKDTHLSPFASYSESYYSEELIEEAKVLFKKAKEVAENDIILRRIELEELSVCLLKTLMNPKDAMKDGSYEQTKRIIEREKIDIGSDNSKAIMKRRVAPYVSSNSRIERLYYRAINWAYALKEFFSNNQNIVKITLAGTVCSILAYILMRRARA